MHFLHNKENLLSAFLYGAYGWLLLSGSLHFGVDVLLQRFRGKRAPGIATTLHYGLNTSYALSQVLFAALALHLLMHGQFMLARGFGLMLGFIAAAAWFSITVLFMEYHQPRVAVAIFAALLVGAALSGCTHL